jgi:hypothetical protein
MKIRIIRLEKWVMGLVFFRGIKISKKEIGNKYT